MVGSLAEWIPHAAASQLIDTMDGPLSLGPKQSCHGPLVLIMSASRVWFTRVEQQRWAACTAAGRAERA